MPSDAPSPQESETREAVEARDPHAAPEAREPSDAHGGSGARRLVLALVALVTLTAISWGMAHVHLGRASTFIAVAIAAVKAVIVAVAFMEVTRASTTARIVALVTVTFIALLCAGVVADIEFR